MADGRQASGIVEDEMPGIERIVDARPAVGVEAILRQQRESGPWSG